MRSQIEQRLHELQAEFEAGQKLLVELRARQKNLRETMLRISGAIQVLEEELQRASPNGDEAGKNIAAATSPQGSAVISSNNRTL